MAAGKWILLTCLLASIAYTVLATCPVDYTVDCNLLNESDCPNYFSNTTGENRSCTWNVALCEEELTTCDDTTTTTEVTTTTEATTTTAVTTTTTLPPGTCGPGETKIIWSVIGVTSSYMEECYFYPNGSLLKCFHASNETICLPDGTDWMKITRPTTMGMLENPEGAVETIFGIARPTLALFSVLFILGVILMMGYVFIFGPLLRRKGY